MDDASETLTLLRAIAFAAAKHRDQRRKDPEASPYINHPIAVATVIAEAGVDDVVVLQAAILHDTIEDTETTEDELSERFGPEVCSVVLEVTDDKSLPKHERKERQVAGARGLSKRAKLVKLGDKIANVRDVAHAPPRGWDVERRLEYLSWTERVVAGCRGTNALLEDLYDEVLQEGLRLVRKAAG